MSTKNPVWLAVGGLLAMAAGMGIGRFVYTPILPAMIRALAETMHERGIVPEWELFDRKLPDDAEWRHVGDPVLDAYITKEFLAANALPLRPGG